MTAPAPPRPPWALAAVAVLVGLEGLVMVLLTVLELLDLHSGQATMAVTTALFFLALAGGLLYCAWGLFRARSWARGPVVAAQLIGLLLSFSFWGGDTTSAALVLLGVCLAVLFGVLLPASTRALAAPEGDEVG